MYPGSLDAGSCWGTWGRVSWYMPGAAISPFVKMCKQSVCFGISAQSDHFHSVDQVHVQTFPSKLIMTSSECPVVTSQWCKGFQMMTFMSTLRGHKRRTHERVGVPVPVESSSRFKCIELSWPPQEYLSASWHWISQEFLHSSKVLCLVLCLITAIHF